MRTPTSSACWVSGRLHQALLWCAFHALHHSMPHIPECPCCTCPWAKQHAPLAVSFLSVGACLQPPHVCVLQELMVCSLHDVIYDKAQEVDLVHLLTIAKDIAAGLAYLHPVGAPAGGCRIPLVATLPLRFVGAKPCSWDPFQGAVSHVGAATGSACTEA